MREKLQTVLLVAALGIAGCSSAEEARSDGTANGRASDELSLWKNPDGTPPSAPLPIGPAHEVGVGLPGLACSSFSELAFAAETLCRRQGLALIALKPNGFCGDVVVMNAGSAPGYGGGASGSTDSAYPPPAPTPPITEPVPPVPGPGPVPGPVPWHWGFDHAIGLCGYGAPPPPPPPCRIEAPCPPPPPPCTPDKPCAEPMPAPLPKG